MTKHKGKCLRCGKLFLGLFGQKYCSTSCRAAHWYTLKKSGNKNTITKIPDGIRLEVNSKNCPYCNGFLYTPAGQPDIIKCENINISCPKGYWSLPPERDVWPLRNFGKRCQSVLQMGRRKQSLSEVLHRQNKFGLRRKTGAAKRPKFISSLDFLPPFCVKTKESKTMPRNGQP